MQKVSGGPTFLSEFEKIFLKDITPCGGSRPTYKVKEDGHGCWLRASLHEQKEEDWPRMLAQG